MKPVIQSQVGTKGTCLAACVASLLECTEAEIGDLYGDQTDDHTPTLDDVTKRLAHVRAVGIAWSSVPPQGWSIGVGRSIRGGPGMLHAVVCEEGRIVHDPSPRGPDVRQDQLFLWGVIVKLALEERDPTIPAAIEPVTTAPGQLLSGIDGARS